jgi:hypothetical protein
VMSMTSAARNVHDVTDLDGPPSAKNTAVMLVGEARRKGRGT